MAKSIKGNLITLLILLSLLAPFKFFPNATNKFIEFSFSKIQTLIVWRAEKKAERISEDLEEIKRNLLQKNKD